MEDSNPPNEEVVGDQLIEDISKIKQFALGEGAAMCQVCGCELREGDDLTAYAFRAAGNPVFEVGFVMCGADEHEHPSVFTRGVHELVVTGRVGLCTDVSTQSSWLVLIEPTPVVVSVASSSSARTVGDSSRDTHSRSTETAEGRDGPTPLLTAVREHMRPDGGGE
ncbi:hypothetical protein EXE43_00600 [Halorubrum sp. SS5]|nr:hypothetical protein EXE43_00600 [Halorubrum sp. SS5]